MGRGHAGNSLRRHAVRRYFTALLLPILPSYASSSCLASTRDLDQPALQWFTPAMLAVGTFLLKSIISPTLGVVPVDMAGQVVIVTGGNSGCGLETVRSARVVTMGSD